MSDLLELSAVDLARKIRAREVSPVEVVDAHVARIERVNGRLNAVVVPTFDRARNEAKRAEARLARAKPEELPPFFGVPFTVKEMVAVEGMPHTGGVVARRAVRAKEDAVLVARMRAAGGIVLGLTNTSEAGLWLESHNRIYGRTENAHVANRISGGSSGGEGAIIGAGGSPMGIGADIGGSIRLPSFFNGIAGHKPTGGLLPSTGHWPHVLGERGRYCVVGPMARRVRDLVAAMEVFSPSEDPHRDAGRPAFVRPNGIRPERMRILHYTDDGVTRADPELRASVTSALDGLARMGFRVEPWKPRGLRLAPLVWIALVSTSSPESVSEILGNGSPIPLRDEWRKLVAGGRSNHPFYSLVMATFDGIDRFPTLVARLRARRDEIRAEIESALGDDGVLVCPPYPRPAPKHHAPLALPLGFAYSGLYNVLELPATAVPTGFSREGLPLGVQVVGPRFADARTLFVAERIEEITGGWRPPVV